MASSEILLEVKNLKQYFRTSRTYTVKAVDDINATSDIAEVVSVIRVVS